jgi:hypothetical protein
MEAVNFPYFGVCTRGFVLDCAISVTAVYLVSVTGKQSVKESFYGLFTPVGSTCDRSVY